MALNSGKGGENLAMSEVSDSSSYMFDDEMAAVIRAPHKVGDKSAKKKSLTDSDSAQLYVLAGGLIEDQSYQQSQQTQSILALRSEKAIGHYWIFLVEAAVCCCFYDDGRCGVNGYGTNFGGGPGFEGAVMAGFVP
ncbi:hypothetical protein Fot_37452 [Forsythia ovata]|uniref:Uncharacterized protein n=1 Tax=Forsythia ovata TaxID=205694 RepID=A0ABD1RZ23_9LAMI